MDYLYTTHVDTEEPIMHLNTHIGDDDEDGPGINGEIFQREMMCLDTMDKKVINCWINSYGGKVIPGYNIFSGILLSKTPIDTLNTGIAMSTAGWCLLAGRKVRVMDYSIFMMHDPSGGDKEILDLFGTSIATIISERSGKNGKTKLTVDDVLNLMKRTTYLTADELYDMGLCDEVLSTSDQNVKYIRQTKGARNIWKLANKINEENALTPTLKNNDMSILNKKLKLVAAANEEAQLEAITLIENRATDAENKVKDLNNTIKELQDKVTQKDTEIQTLKDEKVAAETAANKTKAEVLVKDYVKKGAIKNEMVEIDRFVDLAIKDYSGTEAILKGLPVNRKAPEGGAADTTEEEEDAADAIADPKTTGANASLFAARIKNRQKKAE